jgi:hypothetical protein
LGEDETTAMNFAVEGVAVLRQRRGKERSVGGSPTVREGGEHGLATGVLEESKALL